MNQHTPRNPYLVGSLEMPSIGRRLSVERLLEDLKGNVRSACLIDAAIVPGWWVGRTFQGGRLDDWTVVRPWNRDPAVPWAYQPAALEVMDEAGLAVALWDEWVPDARLWLERIAEMSGQPR